MAMPNTLTGPFIVIAQLSAHPGKGELLQPLLAAVRSNALDKGKEPGCLAYNTVRAEEGDGDEFVVYEKYANKEALEEHRKSEPYLKLRGSGLIKGSVIKFYEEFQ